MIIIHHVVAKLCLLDTWLALSLSLSASHTHCKADAASLECYLSALEKAVAEQFRERRNLSKTDPPTTNN